ncbi:MULTISPECIES: DUF1622 domain-containing protein [Sphingobium]|jgi:uncharacterized membrane protein|uniref:DUF1622 domain-containing protein n=1 Tax=Sphingobium yanoikuyae TaxID=13690 RepID=A0A3G2UN51_SPHYA|nr:MULTISPECIES: DUF1622 domain-containing protein [Sphingobium]AYO76486.1 DUF1622 domain-containing protein [Sphingobium yanoikuyae]PZU65665.1 MAG: hypothetical protein DI540_16330 [Sphingobium sp.]
MALEEFVHQLAEYVALLVNLMAILAIAIGSVQSAIGLTGLLLFKADESKLMPVWMSFGRWAVAGLSFQLAADIVETSIAPTWAEIGKLGAIAAIRTFLNYFLDRNLEGIREREKAKAEAETV